ncbi:MAG: hypothetical protein WBM44_04655, partial [Waterburya sp.]
MNFLAESENLLKQVRIFFFSQLIDLRYETRNLFRGCLYILNQLFIMNTLTGIQIEGNLITFDLTTELLSNELKGQTPKD